MPSYVVRSRLITAWKEETIEAETREEAIHEVISTAPEGSEVEVSTVVEMPPAESEPRSDSPTTKAAAHSGAKRSHKDD